MAAKHTATAQYIQRTTVKHTAMAQHTQRTTVRHCDGTVQAQLVAHLLSAWLLSSLGLSGVFNMI
jgi:hypothetical protein